MRERRDFFDTAHLGDDLKGRAVRGGAATVVGRFGNFVVQSASTVVLARLIAPEEFGLIAMIMAVTGFAAMFNDLGLSIATVQRPSVTHEQVSTLFWINVALGLCLTLVVAGLAPVMVWFYGQPQLLGLTLALSLCFVLNGLMIQHQALIRRQMRFSALAMMRVVAQAVGAVVGIVGACFGLRAWALVGMELAQPLAGVVGVYVLCPWVPGRPRLGIGIRNMVMFGGNFTAVNLLNYFARNLDNLLIGRVWGAEALGIYSKAYQLLMMPIRQLNAPLTHVAVPTLSRLQEEPDRYRRYYCRTLSLIGFVSTPVIGIMIVLSRETIQVLLGSQWVAASPVFSVLAVSAWLQVFVNTTGWIYVSQGRADRMLRWAAIAIPIIVVSFFAGLPWGPLGVASSYTVCTVLVISYPSLAYAYRGSPVSMADFLSATWRPVVVSALMTGLLATIHHLLLPCHVVTAIAVCSAAGLVFQLVAVMLWPALRQQAGELLEAVKLLRGGKPAPASNAAAASEAP